MTREEFSNGFDVLLGKKHFDIQLDEYEKSVLLTKAEKEILLNLYDGKLTGDSFEGSEKLRRYLEPLVTQKEYDISKGSTIETLTEDSILFDVPSDCAFITLEQITYDDDSLGCYDKSTVPVQPITQDEYNKIKSNPFKGPTKYKAIRLDTANNKVEIISKYKIGKYLMKYVKVPKPIILIDLPKGLTIDGRAEATDCELHPLLHDAILTRAVALAITKSVTEK